MKNIKIDYRLGTIENIENIENGKIQLTDMSEIERYMFH
jgi:hypothetical protein